MKLKLILLLVILLTTSTTFTIAQDKPAARETFNWKTYHSASIIPEDSITPDKLFGNWIEIGKTVVKGDYHIESKPVGPSKNAMEIKGNKYRKTLAGKFYSYEINGNQVIFQAEQNADTAYINILTPQEMKISFKQKEDYVQYHYKK